MTTVVEVEVAPDLKSAKAYISVLGDDEAQQNTLAGLKSAEGYIRRALDQIHQFAQHTGDPFYPGSVH